MLFKKEHKDMILKGHKTQTRRIWKRPMVKVGGIYKAKLNYSKDYFAKIQVTRLYKQRLGDMDIYEAVKEGYTSRLEFQEVWIIINGFWDPNTEVDVIEFRVVKEE